MIILDTNVVSEGMKPAADPSVSGWLDRQAPETLFLTSVTVAVIQFGIANLLAGRRKKALAKALDALLDLFQERVLSFDTLAARHYAEVASKARAAGKGLPLPDGYIAAIAAAHGFAVATRDVAPFEAAAVPVINPWRD